MILIKNGRILTMAGIDYEKGCILIKDKKILEVAEHIEEKDGMQVIDALGGWVMPGIIEAHCHVGITEEKKGFEGDDCNEMTNPITPYLKAIDAINPMDAAFDDAVRAGITSVMVGPGSSNVVGGQFVFMKTKGRTIDNLVILEPAAMKVSFGENPKQTYNQQKKMPSTRMATAALLREALFNAVFYKKRKEAAHSKREEFTEDFRQEAWMPVLEKKIPLKAHVHRADDVLTAIRIAKTFDVLMTLDHCSEGHLIAENIAASGFAAIVGSALTSRNKIETQNVDFKTAGILNAAGIKIAITTDHPVTPIQYLPKCAGFAVKKGLDIKEGLRAITINAAEICGVSNRVGSLEVGKDADIAIFDGNPMEVFTKTLYTLIDGRIVCIDETIT
ncbi:MAG: amidohydrolase [Clostridia bacterium]|jgi:imidazolonepropionase-like amidohydrolase|nr:amidohydrolase [Clostridia bacterium]